MTATVRLGDDTALTFDALTNTNRVLLSIEGRRPGDVLNCALIPAESIPAVIASLQLAAKQLKP